MSEQRTPDELVETLRSRIAAGRCSFSIPFVYSIIEALEQSKAATGLLQDWLLASDDFDFEAWVRRVRDLVEDGSEAGCLSRPAGGGVAEQSAPVGETSVAPQPACAKCGATVRVLEVEPNGWLRLDSHKCHVDSMVQS